MQDVHWAQRWLDEKKQEIEKEGFTPNPTKFQTQKQLIRDAVAAAREKAISYEDFQDILQDEYGRYRNVFLEDYSELEIAELDTLIEDLSAYMQSTGRKYADHAATLRSWSARKKRQQKPGAGIPDYTYNKEESL